MEKLNLGVVFGGMSTENEVSIVSANAILRNLDSDKYNIYPINKINIVHKTIFIILTFFILPPLNIFLYIRKYQIFFI